MIKQLSSKKFYLALSTLIVVCGFSLPSFSATYYACDSGFEFQVENGAARCFKAPTSTTTNPNICGNVNIPVVNQSIGHFLQKDYQGNRDKCVGTFKVGPVSNVSVLDVGCPPGYSIQVRRGKDLCRKTIPSSTKAPTRQVNR